MPEYLLERSAACGDERAALEGARSAREAAEKLTRRGSVRCRRSISVPSAQTCFVLFEAESDDAVRNAAALAKLPYERVSAVLAGQSRSLTEEEEG